MGDGNLKTLSQALDDFVSSFKVSNKMFEITLSEDWEEIVGKLLARNTIVKKIDKKVLYIECQISALKQELFYNKSLIIQKVNEHYKKDVIKDLFIQ